MSDRMSDGAWPVLDVYYPQNATQFDATHISEFLLRRLSGLDSPQTWNPFRGAIIFLPSRDVAVALMHSFSAIVVIFLWDITMYISFPFNVFNVISNSVPLRALCGGLCDQSPIFLFTSSPIYHHWTTYNFGMPALRYFAVYVFTTDHFLFCALSVRHFAEPFLSENLRVPSVEVRKRINLYLTLDFRFCFVNLGFEEKLQLHLFFCWTFEPT